MTTTTEHKDLVNMLDEHLITDISQLVKSFHNLMKLLVITVKMWLYSKMIVKIVKKKNVEIVGKLMLIVLNVLKVDVCGVGRINVVVMVVIMFFVRNVKKLKCLE